MIAEAEADMLQWNQEMESAETREEFEARKNRELDKRKARAYALQGHNNLGEGLELAAISDFTKAIELNPDDHYYYFSRGLAKEDFCDYQGALSDYTKAIELNPDNERTWITRGNLYFRLEYYEEALDDCNSAIEVNHNSGYGYYFRHHANFQLGRIGESYRDLKKALAIAERTFDDNLYETVKPEFDRLERVLIE